MFFWFIGTAIVTVGVVFRDPRFDYRLLIVGSVLPIADGVAGGARALHSVTVSVGLLAALMIATSGRKPIRKLLLGLPIGMILHLVFDGAWNNTEVFWWPFFGLSFDDSGLPIFDRGWWSLPLEAIGPELRPKLDPLAPGENTGILEDREGFSIYLVEAREGERPATFDDMRDRIELLLQQQRTREMYERILDEARQQTFVENRLTPGS